MFRATGCDCSDWIEVEKVLAYDLWEVSVQDENRKKETEGRQFWGSKNRKLKRERNE